MLCFLFSSFGCCRSCDEAEAGISHPHVSCTCVSIRVRDVGTCEGCIQCWLGTSTSSSSCSPLEFAKNTQHCQAWHAEHALHMYACVLLREDDSSLLHLHGPALRDILDTYTAFVKCEALWRTWPRMSMWTAALTRVEPSWTQGASSRLLCVKKRQQPRVDV
eukprot:1787593-Amphidinium_carterae.1